MPQYTPDSGFMAKLRAIDPLLDAHWDSKRQRWIITRQARRPGGYTVDAVITVVENPDGSYRPLDDRTIRGVKWADGWNRRRGARDIVDDIEAREQQEEEERDRAFSTEIEGITRDVRRHVAGHPIFPVGAASF